MHWFLLKRAPLFYSITVCGLLFFTVMYVSRTFVNLAFYQYCYLYKTDTRLVRGAPQKRTQMCTHTSPFGVHRPGGTPAHHGILISESGHGDMFFYCMYPSSVWTNIFYSRPVIRTLTLCKAMCPLKHSLPKPQRTVRSTPGILRSLWSTVWLVFSCSCCQCKSYSRDQQRYSCHMMHTNKLTKEATKPALWVVNKLQYHTWDAERKADNISSCDVC